MKNRASGKDVAVYLSMIMPALVIYLLIIAYPVLNSIVISFTDYNPLRNQPMSFLGLSNYTTMFRDPDFWHAFRNNMIVVGVSVFGQIPIGFILAYILFRKLVKQQAFFQAMIFMPQFLSTIVIGILWRRIFLANGPVSRLIQLVSGDPTRQFTMMLYPETVMIPIAFALIWIYTGFFMIIFLANLQKIDTGMIEAAQIDGASESQIFLKIIVPLLSGVILINAILAIAGSFRGFDLIFSMTTQGIQRDNAMVLPIFMYQKAFQDRSNDLRFAYGAAIANAIVLISISIIMFANFVGKKFGTGEEH
ncbi:carbohydrate ABC transporter permease [Spirochaeta dissipatitropha]